MGKAKLLQALDRLLAETVRPRDSWRSGNSTRSAWIMIPRDSGIAAAHLYPALPAYDMLRSQFVVPYWNPIEAERVLERREQSRKTFSARQFQVEDAKLRAELKRHASVTGYTLSNGGPYFFPDLNDCLYSCNESQLLPLEHREEYSFRSKGAIRLTHRSEPIGVILLCDTAIRGFGDDDRPVLEMVAALATPLVARALERNYLTFATRRAH